ncbi:hypothetical protein B0T17DRAFT_615594 [Bombardia bombarda]|uniref:DUF4484 domain-containing protein n=1 Tax=Bombardia bombarda TaxID=252184 RepID=A0AA39X9N6_9PEZI|nr:hypothetical protein B0T17DRAFT_615594 [Bombardia bombarda]
MAASRRGQPPLSVRLPPTSSAAALPDLPPVSALFLIDFDVKAGYTIVWKRAVAGLELEGVVEYKSLPSGLHTVPEDLIYFVHDDGHAGLSAFVNAPTDDEEARHARMIAVGVLVPLSYGRLGRAWRHAEALKSMASQLASDGTQTQLLEHYWEKNGTRDVSSLQPLKEHPLDSPALSFKSPTTIHGKGHARNRSASDGTALMPPGHRLSPYHPAWSLTSLLDTFGPLIFPIHRAALLRKRILISTHAPVHEACNFVYDISVLSNIPLSVCDIVEPSAPVQRLRPLFNIGVHDISYLLEHQAATKQHANRNPNDDAATSSEESGPGWVACTTDSILAMKEGLWDMLVTMPPVYASSAKEQVWPTVESPKGVPVKATQRDLRRFRALRTSLTRLAASASSSAAPPAALSPSYNSETTTESFTSATLAIRLSKPPPSSSRPGTSCEAVAPSHALAVADDDSEKIVEPTTWAALAYNGFMWWASAGEQRRSDEVEEQSHDTSLLADLTSPISMPQRRMSFGTQQSVEAAGGGSLVDSVSSLTAAAARREDGGEGEGGGENSSSIRSRNDDEQARVELAIITYFHRLTTSVLGVLADIVDSTDDDDLVGIDFDAAAAAAAAGVMGGDDGEETAGLLRGENDDDDEGGNGGWIRVDSDALAHMGLDVWSKSDAEFIRGLAARYFARRACLGIRFPTSQDPAKLFQAHIMSQAFKLSTT